MKTLLLTIILLLTACSHQNIQKNSSSKVEMKDLATEFLETVCDKQSGPSFGEAWLRYEERHWDLFSSLFYKDKETQEERIGLAKDLADRRDEMCKYTRAFLFVAPNLIDKLEPAVSELMDQAPKSKIYLVAALQWTDGRGDDVKGEEVYVLNARHDTYARTSGMVVTIVHELIHSAQSSKFPLREMLPPIPRALYSEGGAVYGVTLLFPEIGERATGMSEQELVSAKLSMRNSAKEILNNWNEQNSNADLLKKYFSGGSQDIKVPRKMGYFLGLHIYRKLKSDGVRISPQKFSFEAKKVLEELAK